MDLWPPSLAGMLRRARGTLSSCCAPAPSRPLGMSRSRRWLRRPTRGDREWGQLLELADTVDTEEESLPIPKALGSGSSAALVVKTLDYSVSGKVRSQDVPVMINACSDNPVGRDVTWDYVKANWSQFHDRFLTRNFLMARIVTASAEGFSSETRAKEVFCFLSPTARRPRNGPSNRASRPSGRVRPGWSATARTLQPDWSRIQHCEEVGTWLFPTLPPLIVEKQADLGTKIDALLDVQLRGEEEDRELLMYEFK
ncbi:hypothetical protein SARC_02254 [Sphaeroforma arctica JP610]|uniref:ERAP1-like C-terminal domain-containing protein n=1 Tax=Sphaeroforma arctica JP610 TaxID=667725 RepID=A0A0L0G9B1_9EUKA|nr:hypothetical protein SARC_02254 [Sphaeroforma arctica JP610]KNC85565.1 hypothetical protein SARC_02254 [Sphaeroforma arctica JP610]|eukprot:XP_014159467.1 hypothetical protein SARC_02254 [Sphaeroforma arctica JP610]